MERTPLTPKEYEELRARLERLKNEEMPRVQRAMAHAKELGDISESSEFESAREELWRVEREISELEAKLASADIVTDAAIPEGEAGLGRIVRVVFLPGGVEDEFILVSGGGAAAAEGPAPVSIDSPMGQALVGRRAGDEVEYDAPRGRMRLRILEVRSA
jgi:transcription elongation factor GreA